MRSDAREGAGWGRAAAGVALLLSACAPWAGDTLDVAERIPLPHADYSTLAGGEGTRLWVGRPGELLGLDAGRPARPVAVGGREAPRVLGLAGGLLLVREGDRVLAVDPASASVRAERADAGGAALAVDVRGRLLFQAGGSGAVLGRDPATLDPVWGWPAVEGAATAIGLSPEGDRVYLALAGDGDEGEGGARLQVRDLQTGRVLGTEALPARASDLRVGSDGTVFALVEGRGGGAVLALEPRGGGMRLRWRRTLDALRLEAPAFLAYGAARDRLVVVSRQRDAGLRVLDAEAGEVVGSLREAPLEAAFGPAGDLYLLFPGEVRRVAG